MTVSRSVFLSSICLAFPFSVALFPSVSPGNQIPTLSTPFTYTIDYSEGQVRSATFGESWGESVPVLYHMGPTPTTLGPSFVAYSDPRWKRGDRHRDRSSAAGIAAIHALAKRRGRHQDGPSAENDVGMREWHERVKAHTKRAHEHGVRWIIPYYCSQTAYGGPDKTNGIWGIYHSWNRFRFAGLGAKPDRDPLLWMQRDHLGQLKFNYPFNTFLQRKQSDWMRRWAPCMSDPDWIDFSKGYATSVAGDGYDGMFIDNCIQHSYAPHAQVSYREWLKTQYSLDELKEDLGCQSFEEARLHHEGDLIRWAMTFEDWIPWLEEKYPVEERSLYFNTVGPLDATAVNAAGDGFLVGAAEDFIREKFFKECPNATWEEVRAANPALQTPQGKTRWAKTKQFWSWAAAKWLEVVRDAGREIDPDFFLVPNWGSMERIIGTLGRSETGKDLALFSKACPMQMYEEGQDVAQVVPGVISHFNPGLKLAFQNGVTAVHLAYDQGGPDSTALRHAETAAYGCVCVQHSPHWEVQQRYQTFFETHEDWYEGYVSAAPVGLLHMYDQVYFDNQRHLVALDQIHNMLGRWQVAFDHVIEKDLDSANLSRYTVLIAPAFCYVSTAQLEALMGYVEHGGCLIAVAAFADHDDAARPRDLFPAPLAKALEAGEAKCGEGRIITIPTLVEAVADPGIPYEKLLQTVNATTELVPENRSERGEYFTQMDRQFGLQRFRADNPVVKTLRSVLGNSFGLLDPEEAEDVRLTWYEHPKTGDRVVHLVNYRLPLQGEPKKRKIQEISGLSVRVPLAGKTKAPRVRVAFPGEEDTPIANCQVENGVLTVPVPAMKEYALVRVSGN